MKTLGTLFFGLMLSFGYGQYTKFESELDSLAEQIDFHYKTGKLMDDNDLFKQIATILIDSAYQKISIEAHTDSRGKMEDNFILSKNVAEKVKKILVELGVAPQLITTVGWAESRPRGCIIDPRKNRAWNRRVEIIVQK